MNESALSALSIVSLHYDDEIKFGQEQKQDLLGGLLFVSWTCLAKTK